MSVVLTDVRGAIGIATLNRPEALNALNTPLLDALAGALEAWDANPAVRVMIVTGSEKAFAAGADIKEMQASTYAETYPADFFSGWEEFTRLRKPIVAAVAGYALGGGCELAMMCDFIIASETAKFGQPEITLGIIPGAGGTQRLTRAIGKAKAMDLVLTGRMISPGLLFTSMIPWLADGESIQACAWATSNGMVTVCAPTGRSAGTRKLFPDTVSTPAADAPPADQSFASSRCNHPIRLEAPFQALLK